MSKVVVATNLTVSSMNNQHDTQANVDYSLPTLSMPGWKTLSTLGSISLSTRGQKFLSRPRFEIVDPGWVSTAPHWHRCHKKSDPFPPPPHCRLALIHAKTRLCSRGRLMLSDPCHLELSVRAWGTHFLCACAENPGHTHWPLAPCLSYGPALAG